MEFLGRHLKRSSRTNDEQRFEKVVVGKDYLGTMSEEWFDAPTTPFRSAEKLDKKPESKTASERREQKRSGGTPPSSEPGEPSSVDSSAAQSTSRMKGKQRQPVQKSPAEKADEMIPILMKLYRLGEEIVPLLMTLAKMGEEWSRMSAPSTSDSRQYPWPKPVPEPGQERKATAPASSAGTDDDTQLTPTASNAAGDESRSKTPAATETDEDSDLTPSTSLSSGSNGHGSRPSRRSQPEDPGFSSFKKICSTEGMLRRPKGIGEHDVCDGINDEATLQCVPKCCWEFQCSFASICLTSSQAFLRRPQARRLRCS